MVDLRALVSGIGKELGSALAPAVVNAGAQLAVDTAMATSARLQGKAAERRAASPFAQRQPEAAMRFPVTSVSSNAPPAATPARAGAPRVNSL